MSDYEAVIGLEVHAQLQTRTKAFCACSTRFGDPPNTHVCPVCLGLPGALPVMNREAVILAVRLARALECTLHQQSRFARKNYFYPDLPKGYQISQYDEPLAEHGRLVIDGEGGPRAIGITRIHLEEDAGKSIHDPQHDASTLDFNRSGVPLVEIVSEPELRTPAEGAAYLRELHAILVTLDVSEGNLEEGSFRCDANVSVRPRGAAHFNTRTEIKNINSFRFVQRALQSEIERQVALYERGETVVQATFGFHGRTGELQLLRVKEEAHDYRYFPEPDLPPLVLDPAFVAAATADLPELPREKRARFQSTLGLSAYDAAVLTASPALSAYYEATLAVAGDAKRAANWVAVELLGALNRSGRDIADCPLPPAELGLIVARIGDGTLTSKLGKEVFEAAYGRGEPVAAAIARIGSPVQDAGLIATVVAEVVAAHPAEVARYRAGKTQLFGFFVGAVMKATRGKADPAEVNRLLNERLSAAAEPAAPGGESP